MSKRKRPRQDASKPSRKIDETLGEAGRKRIEKATDLLGELIDEAVGTDASFEDFEKSAMKIANEIVRRQLERKLQTIADRQPKTLEIDLEDDWTRWETEPGDPPFTNQYRRHMPGTVTYHSLVGALRVRRHSYRSCVRRGAITCIPLELEACLMERMTPGLAKCTAYGFSQVPVRNLDVLLRNAGRCPPSLATLDRCAKDLGAFALACSGGIESKIRASEILPAGTRAIAVGVDRTAVAMRLADVPFENHVSDHESRPKGAPRQAGKGVQWRMDYVATVAFLDGEGERLDSRQYRLASTAEIHEIVERMLADVTHAIDQAPHLHVIVVQDGAPELWIALRRGLSRLSLKNGWEEVLDWYHVDERLTACLDLAADPKDERTKQRAAWHGMLLEQRRGAHALVRSLKARWPKVPSAAQAQFEQHITYFSKRKSMMRYCEMRERNLPIGSGITEGACKSLVGIRAKRSGQHWTQRGLSAALCLRALEQSGRFEAFWERFSAQYTCIKT